MRWKRKEPVSTLRARLEERISERGDYRDYALVEEKTDRGYFLTNLIGRMHRYLRLKFTVAVVVVFLAGFFSVRGFAWTSPVVEGLRYLVTWNVDPGGLFNRAVPAFKTVWENGTLPRLAPNIFVTDTGRTPLEGTLQSAFGLRRHPSASLEQMHYGVDLSASEGSRVRAVLAGKVTEITVENEVAAVLLEHNDGWQTFYRGLAETAVVAGEEVSTAQELGVLGGATVWENPHLHFELRYRGRPVEPPGDWLASFAGG